MRTLTVTTKPTRPTLAATTAASTASAVDAEYSQRGGQVGDRAEIGRHEAERPAERATDERNHPQALPQVAAKPERDAPGHGARFYRTGWSVLPGKCEDSRLDANAVSRVRSRELRRAGREEDVAAVRYSGALLPDGSCLRVDRGAACRSEPADTTYEITTATMTSGTSGQAVGLENTLR